MRQLKVYEEYGPGNTKPAAVAPANPKIDSVPDLNDTPVEICWNSPSYLGEWCLSGPKRTRDEASLIAKEMKRAETGSEPFTERLLPLDAFISMYAQKLNPHGWTIDFTPEDLDWTTDPGQPVHEAEGLGAMPKFLKDAGAHESHFQMGGARVPNQPPNCWELDVELPNKDEALSIRFWPNGSLEFLAKSKSHNYLQFTGKWEATSNANFQFGPKLLKGVKVILSEAFGKRSFLPM